MVGSFVSGTDMEIHLSAKSLADLFKVYPNLSPKHDNMHLHPLVISLSIHFFYIAQYSVQLNCSPANLGRTRKASQLPPRDCSSPGRPNPLNNPSDPEPLPVADTG